MNSNIASSLALFTFLRISSMFSSHTFYLNKNKDKISILVVTNTKEFLKDKKCPGYNLSVIVISNSNK